MTWLLIISALCLFKYTEAVPGVVSSGTGCPVTRLLTIIIPLLFVACAGWIISVCTPLLQTIYDFILNLITKKEKINHSHKHHRKQDD